MQGLQSRPPSRPTPPTRRKTRTLDTHEFAEQLRANSVYPTFRSVVGLAYIFGIIIAVGTALLGLFTAYSTGAGVKGFVFAIFMGLLIFAISKVAKEMSDMLADLSDATLTMAAKQSFDDSSD